MAEQETTVVDALSTQFSDVAIKKVKKTLFWGVSLYPEQIMDCPLVKECLEKNPQLAPLKSIHTTLLYVGRKDDEREHVYEEHLNKKCKVEITGHGFSDKAMALRVNRIIFVDDEQTVPTFAEVQHITIALASGIAAIDSVKTLQGCGSIIDYEEPLILVGKLRKY